MSFWISAMSDASRYFSWNSNEWRMTYVRFKMIRTTQAANYWDKLLTSFEYSYSWLISVSVHHISNYVSRSYDGPGTAILTFPRDARPKTYLFNRHEILRRRKEIHKTNTSHTTTYPRYAGASFLLDHCIYRIGLLHVHWNEQKFRHTTR